ncbi:MAG: PAS domain-containing protein, partial [Planctomycetaceae bacterium]|nr:PAS domain-containing protein [Planctomycetaceae bacterium]
MLEFQSTPLEADDFKSAAVIGKPFWETYWWSHSSETQQTLKQALTRSTLGEVVRFDTKMRLSEARMMDLDITFGPVYDEKGQPCKVLVSAVDITDRLIAEKKAARKTAQFEAMLQVNPDLFFHVHIDGTIASDESGKLKNFLLSTETLHQKQISDLFPETVATQFEQAIAQVIRSRKAAAF